MPLWYSPKKKQRGIEFHILDTSVMKTELRTHPPKNFTSQVFHIMQFDLLPLPSMFASHFKHFSTHFESMHGQFVEAKS